MAKEKATQEGFVWTRRATCCCNGFAWQMNWGSMWLLLLLCFGWCGQSSTIERPQNMRFWKYGLLVLFFRCIQIPPQKRARWKIFITKHDTYSNQPSTLQVHFICHYHHCNEGCTKHTYLNFSKHAMHVSRIVFCIPMHE